MNIWASLLTVCGIAAAGEPSLTGKQVLDKVREVTSAADRKATAVMTITDRNKRVQSRTMRMVMKGDKQMMMTFQSPADLRGVTFMTTSTENMWIYLPAQGRVRRISGSMADQGFGGSDFSYKEMANISFADESGVEKMSETRLDGKAAWLLELKDGDGKRSRLWVDKGQFLPLQVEQLGVDGKPTKRILFADFENKEKSWIPASVQMLDLSRGSSTELKLTKLELNSGVKDNFFTEANIKKGA